MANSKNHLPTSKQTRRNVVFIWGNRLLLVIAPLVITPLVINQFGLAVMGVWLLTTQLAAQLTLLDAGMVTSLTRLLARKRLADPGTQTERIISTTFWLLMAVGVSLIACAPIIATYFITKFPIPKNVLLDSWWLVVLTVVFVGVSLPLRCGYGMLGSKHRFDIVQIYDTIPIVLRLGLVVLLTHFALLNLLNLGLIIYICNLLGLLLIFFEGLKFFGGIKILNIRKISYPIIYPIASLSASATIISISSVILMQGIPTFIGYHLDVRAVSLITIPLFIYTSITPFFATFAAIISPIAAGTTTDSEFKQLRSFYTITNTYLCSAAFAIFLVNYAFGDLLLRLWLSGPTVNNSDIGRMSNVLSIMLASLALSVNAPMARSILGSIGRHWRAALTDLITSLLGVFAAVLLVICFDLGVLGATLGIAVTFILRGPIVYPILLADTFKISSVHLARGYILRPLVIVLITMAAGEWIQMVCDREQLIQPLSRLTEWSLPALTWTILTWRYVVIQEHKFAFVQELGRIRQKLWKS